MSRPVGVLMKRERSHGVFLTADGRFINGRATVSGAEIGQEVEFVPMRPRVTEWARLGLVAVLMLAVMVSGVSVYLTRPVIAAYVTIDINPSLELGIDQHEIVRSVVALNNEAEALMVGLKLVGKPVTDAFEVIMTSATEGGYLGGEGEHLVVITTTSVAKQETDEDENLTAELDSKARAIVSGQEQTFVSSMVAAPEVREEARKQGVSVGKLMVAQKAEEVGIHLDPEELKSANLSQSIRAAGGDPNTILKRGNGRSDLDTNQDEDSKEKQGANVPENDQPDKGGSKSSGKNSSNQSKQSNDSQMKDKENGSDKDKANTGNGKTGAPGQIKR